MAQKIGVGGRKTEGLQLLKSQAKRDEVPEIRV